MKKSFVKVFVIALVIFAMPLVCFASRHSVNTAKLTNLCEYYGWYVDNASFGKSCTSFTAITEVNDMDYYTAKMKVKTVKKGKKYRSAYYAQGQKCSLKSIEKMLKKYSTSYGRDVVLSQKATDAIDNLIDYGEKRGWKTEISEEKSCSTVTFSNSKYCFKATASASRNTKQKKIVIAYLRDGKSSTESAVKDWLTTYTIT